MSNYGEFLKQLSEKDKDFFFGKGNWKKVTNQYYTFKRVLDDDNIIILTSNVKVLKESYVLIVDNNKGVYLKDWQVKKVRNYDFDIYGYVVKLNRNYFKPYTFNFDFDDMSFEKEDTFDNLLQVAKEQDSTNLKIAFGWGK